MIGMVDREFVNILCFARFPWMYRCLDLNLSVWVCILNVWTCILGVWTVCSGCLDLLDIWKVRLELGIPLTTGEK